MVNRWVPWWVHNSFGTGPTPPTTGYFTRQEFDALPPAVQPLMQHLCVDIYDTLQEGHRARAAAAGAQSQWGFSRVGEKGLKAANAHVRVRIAKL